MKYEKPKKEDLKLSENLVDYMMEDTKNLEKLKYSIDSVLEWLNDNNMLNKKGTKFAHLFWWGNIKENMKK